ncbi:cytochrome P450 4A10 [Podospora fimiseda]|uniref:Cytochrome P450 4A10 n=1 Tax=Podospora fimiseda TaxID=252190 RepID=A0AAN7H8B3_9PEZI|nr:cytochrome P450 4A10 [Podospora fimiseda]
MMASQFSSLFLEIGKTNPWLTGVFFLNLCLFTLFAYRVHLHPLSHVPGPLVAKCSSLWLHYHAYVGDECTRIRRLHEKYGPVVRVAPNEVDIADGDAIAHIYSAKTDLVKSSHYTKFAVDTHTTVFSTLETTDRSARLKAVMPLFSASGVRESKPVIEDCVAEFVMRLKTEAESGRVVDVLNLTEAFACDVTTACLFGESYGALKETVAPFSVAGYFDSFLSPGRFFYMPTATWAVLEWLAAALFSNKQIGPSISSVNSYVDRLLKSSKTKSSSFQGRLLSQGVPPLETAAECKDSIFAGGYFIGVVVAHILWFLVRNPDKYAALRRELLDSRTSSESLPYLQSVVKEGLRLSMPSPARLPRIVSKDRLIVQNYRLPPGTNVGLGALQLHLNPDVFPEPEKFLPERWEHPTAEMRRDWVPFGMGVRSCIGRVLSNVVILEVIKAVVESDLLAGVRAVQEKIEVKEWTISQLKEKEILLAWG